MFGVLRCIVCLGFPDLRVESPPATWWQGLLGEFSQSEGHHQFLCCLPSPHTLDNQAGAV